jgi:prepilin-type N-terminal cleavage/methylation domain-containing protein
MRKTDATHNRGFTLIELLVVVAIISLLLAILLPSLQKAKDLARQSVCSIQLRSFGLGLAQYAAENDDSLPLSGGLPRSGAWEPWSDPKNWLLLLWPTYVPSKDNPNRNLIPSSPWLCPMDARIHGEEKVQKTSYAMNIWLTGFYNSTYGPETPYKLAEVPSLSETPAMTERDGQPWGGQPESLQWESGFFPFPHRHQDGDHFLYLDSHVSLVPNLDVPGDGWMTRVHYRYAEEYFVQDDRFWR